MLDHSWSPQAARSTMGGSLGKWSEALSPCFLVPFSSSRGPCFHALFHLQLFQPFSERFHPHEVELNMESIPEKVTHSQGLMSKNCIWIYCKDVCVCVCVHALEREDGETEIERRTRLCHCLFETLQWLPATFRINPWLLTLHLQILPTFRLHCGLLLPLNLSSQAKLAFFPFCSHRFCPFWHKLAAGSAQFPMSPFWGWSPSSFQSWSKCPQPPSLWLHTLFLSRIALMWQAGFRTGWVGWLADWVSTLLD